MDAADDAGSACEDTVFGSEADPPPLPATRHRRIADRSGELDPDGFVSDGSRNGTAIPSQTSTSLLPGVATGYVLPTDTEGVDYVAGRLEGSTAVDYVCLPGSDTSPDGGTAGDSVLGDDRPTGGDDPAGGGDSELRAVVDPESVLTGCLDLLDLDPVAVAAADEPGALIRESVRERLVGHRPDDGARLMQACALLLFAVDPSVRIDWSAI